MMRCHCDRRGPDFMTAGIVLLCMAAFRWWDGKALFEGQWECLIAGVVFLGLGFMQRSHDR